MWSFVTAVMGDEYRLGLHLQDPRAKETVLDWTAFHEGWLC